MLRILRAVVVIGVIVYLSPTRQDASPPGEPSRPGQANPSWSAIRERGMGGMGGMPLDLKQLQTTWNDLPPGAQDALRRIIARSAQETRPDGSEAERTAAEPSARAEPSAAAAPSAAAVPSRPPRDRVR